MSYKTTTNKEHIVIAIQGNMDAKFVTDKREQLEKLREETLGNVIFDFSSTEFIDSSGIGFLVFMFKRLKPEARDITIIGLNGQPKKVVEMLRINRMIRCCNNLREATPESTDDSEEQELKVKKLASPTRLF